MHTGMQRGIAWLVEKLTQNCKVNEPLPDVWRLGVSVVKIKGGSGSLSFKWRWQCDACYIVVERFIHNWTHDVGQNVVSYYVD
jgi:hypothetical protein